MKSGATPTVVHATKRRVGRPTNYTSIIASKICARIAEGESLRSVCRDNSMPCMTSVMKWLSEHQEFAKQYAIARETQADQVFDENDDVARDAMRKCDSNFTNAARLFIDTQKWRLARMNPKKYGDTQIIEHSGTLDIGHYMAHDQKIIDRYNAKRAGAPEPLTIDNKPAPEEE